MELAGSIKTLLIAQEERPPAVYGCIVKELGPDGQHPRTGLGRMTIRKGMRELDSGVECIDAFTLRGRKQAEDHCRTS